MIYHVNLHFGHLVELQAKEILELRQNNICQRCRTAVSRILCLLSSKIWTNKVRQGLQSGIRSYPHPRQGNMVCQI